MGRRVPGAAGRLTRLGDILGGEFRSHALEVHAEREGVVVTGYAAAPALTKANALGQYLFVNGRPVRDKLILGGCAPPIPIICRPTGIRCCAVVTLIRARLTSMSIRP